MARYIWQPLATRAWIIGLILRHLLFDIFTPQRLYILRSSGTLSVQGKCAIFFLATSFNLIQFSGFQIIRKP